MSKYLIFLFLLLPIKQTNAQLSDSTITTRSEKFCIQSNVLAFLGFRNANLFLEYKNSKKTSLVAEVVQSFSNDMTMLGVNYRFYKKTDTFNSSFKGLFLQYRSNESTLRIYKNHTADTISYAYQGITFGANIGRKFVFAENFSFSIRIGAGFPIGHITLREPYSDKISTSNAISIKIINGIDGEFMLGYIF